MTQRYAATAATLKFDSANTCGAFRTNVRNNFFAAAAMRIAQRFLRKVAEDVSDEIACGKRTVEYWQSDTREMDMQHFFKVLAIDPMLGAKVLDEMWERIPPATRAVWQRDLERRFEDARAEQEERAYEERKRQREASRAAQDDLPFARRARR
jgi:hypothetical protein